MMMRGVVSDMETGELMVSGDRGYSFCNCYNIFFTDWNNIKQDVYDETYSSKYLNQDSQKIATSESDKMSCVFKKLNKDAKTFFEVGSVNDYILDNMKNHGYEVSGLDIIKHDSKHDVKICDFEDYETTEQYDIIWASHVFEHFKNPTLAILKLKDMLSKNGLLYIAMPDTFFIDFEHRNVLNWDWIVNEHHILWGMDSFIEFCEEVGLKCLIQERSHELNQRTDGTWFWKQDFKVVLTHA
jgi:predicted SAM-dependent methyltransferase